MTCFRGLVHAHSILRLRDKWSMPHLYCRRQCGIQSKGRSPLCRQHCQTTDRREFQHAFVWNTTISMHCSVWHVMKSVTENKCEWCCMQWGVCVWHHPEDSWHLVVSQESYCQGHVISRRAAKRSWLQIETEKSSASISEIEGVVWLKADCSKITWAMTLGCWPSCAVVSVDLMVM